MTICLLVVISISLFENQALIFQISFFLYQLVSDLIVYPNHGVSHQNLSVNIRHGHTALLCRPFSRTQVLPTLNFCWNTLPVDVVTLPTLCSFKSCLKYVL